MRQSKFILILIAAFVAPCALAQTRVPLSIDSAGKIDVTEELNAFISSLPENAIIVFPSNKVYRIEGILTIRNKKNLVINGNGSSVVAQTTGKDIAVSQGKPRHNWPRSRHHVSIENSENITISNLKIKGPHASAGVGAKAYVKELEAQHGVNIFLSKKITLDSMRITNVYGDCIYIGGGVARGSSDSIVVKNSFLGFTGRQGIAITHGTTIIIQGCEFSNVRRTHIDLEGNNVGSVIKNIHVKNNTFRSSRLNWISAAGKGFTGEVYFIGNKLIGKDAKVMIGNRNSKTFGPFYIMNNQADRPVGNPQGAAWKIVNVDGFYAFNNSITLQKKRNMHLVGQRHSSNIFLKNNVLPNSVGVVKDY